MDFLKRLLLNFFGVALLLFAVWQYAQRQLLPPLENAVSRGNGIAMLQGFGGPLTGNDFLHIYLGSRLLWHGYDPYSPETMIGAGERLIGRAPLPYVYLPFTGLVLYPIAALDYGTAFLAWFLVSHFFVLAAIPITIIALGLPFSFRNFIFALLILAVSFPLYRSLSAGQLNAPLMCGYALFYLMLGRAHPALTGVLAAGLMFFKLSPGILLIYLAWMRMWRDAGWMVFWSVTFTAVAVAIFGLAPHLDFLPVLRDMGYGRSTWSEFGHSFFSDPANQSLNSLFHHLFAQTPQTAQPLMNLGSGLANALTWMASIILLGIVLYSTVRQRKESCKEPLSYSLFIFLSLLIPSLMWDHYLIQIFFPILAIYAALRERKAWVKKAAFLIGLIVISIPFHFGSAKWQSGFGLVMMSFKLWGLLLLFSVNVMLMKEKTFRPGEKPDGI